MAVDSGRRDENQCPSGSQVHIFEAIFQMCHCRIELLRNCAEIIALMTLSRTLFTRVWLFSVVFEHGILACDGTARDDVEQVLSMSYRRITQSPHVTLVFDTLLYVQAVSV